MLLLPLLLPSQTNQRGRRKTTKQGRAFISLPGPQCWGQEKLWNLGREESSRLAVMDAATKKNKQFNCSLWFLCCSTQNPIQCRLGKFLSLFPTLSFCSSGEVKQNVMYCILYDFSERNNGCVRTQCLPPTPRKRLPFVDPYIEDFQTRLFFWGRYRRHAVA